MGKVELGQGSVTAVAQVCAEEMVIDFGRLQGRFRRHPAVSRRRHHRRLTNHAELRSCRSAGRGRSAPDSAQSRRATARNRRRCADDRGRDHLRRRQERHLLGSGEGSEAGGRGHRHRAAAADFRAQDHRPEHPPPRSPRQVHGRAEIRARDEPRGACSSARWRARRPTRRSSPMSISPRSRQCRAC